MKRPVLERARVVEKREIAPRVFWLTLEAPLLAAQSPPRPGQFLHVLPGDGPDPLLRRPISVLDFDAGAARVELYLQVFGRGSAALAGAAVGGELDILGPVGRPFREADPARTLYLAAGGVGLAPLYFWAREMGRARAGAGQRTPPPRVELLLGARSRRELPGGGLLERLPRAPQLATDDGSVGFRGTVVDLLEDMLERETGPVELAGCGPPAMLGALARLAARRRVPCQVSMEQVMGCAMGACQGCVVPARLRDRESGSGEGYARVCTEGPVFEAEEVNWEALAGRGLFAGMEGTK